MSSAHRLPADSSTRDLVVQAKVVKSASLPTLQLQTETNVILALCKEFSEWEKRNAVRNCNLCHPQNSWPFRCAREVVEPRRSFGFVMSFQVVGVCFASTSSLALMCRRRSVPIKTNWAVSLARPHCSNISCNTPQHCSQSDFVPTGTSHKYYVYIGHTHYECILM